MGRYEVLLKKPVEKIIKMISNRDKGVVVSESPEEFLKKLFKGRPLTKNEINDNLVNYYGRYSDKKGLGFEIQADEEGGLEISPSNDYTIEVMQKVRNVFKDKRT